MKVDLKKLAEKHTKDGVIDYEAAQNDFQDQWNGYEAKQKPNTEKLLAAAKVAGASEFITGLGIENVTDKEGFTSYVGGISKSATDKDAEMAGMTAKYKDYDIVKESLAKAEGTIFTNSVKSEIRKSFNDDYVDDVYELAHKQVNDETPVDEVVKKFAENDKYAFMLKVKANSRIHVKRQQDNKPGDGNDKKKNPSQRYW